MEQGGSSYSFAKREYVGMFDGLRMTGSGDLSRCEFAVDRFGAPRVFLAEVGNHPIASLAQGDFPFEAGQKWSSLTGREFSETNWPGDKDPNGKVVDGITIARRLLLHLGSAYLMRAKSPGAEYVTVFQCFQVQETAKVLIAWRILYVFLSNEEAPEVLPWWNPRAWKGLLKESPESAARIKRVAPAAAEADTK